MIQRLSFASYAFRHALSVSFAVFSAVIINYYFSFSKEGWIIITAFLVSQTTRGAPLRQGLIYFFIIMGIAALLSIHHIEFIRYRLIDIIIGGILGATFSQVVLPVKAYAEFSQGIVPLLNALLDYSQEFALSFVHHRVPSLLAVKKAKIEEILATHQGRYPEWVYEVGFNPGLRSGFRFFFG